MANQKNVAVLVYNGVELVDMNGPLDAFSHANQFNIIPYNVYTVAETADAVKSEGNIVTILPQYTIDNCPTPDIIIIPGVLDAQSSPTIADPAIIAWIKTIGETTDAMILSVCIGFFSLAATGLLKGKKATTHYLSVYEAEAKFKETTIIKNVRYVHDGKFVTTGGITSGIDGALKIIELQDGYAVAQATADIMVYNREAPLPPLTLLPAYYPPLITAYQEPVKKISGCPVMH